MFLLYFFFAVIFPAFQASNPLTFPDIYTGSFTPGDSTIYKGGALSDILGVSSSEAGDINNDGIPDFLIGDSMYNNGRGIVYVVYGKQGALRDMSSLDDFSLDDGFTIKGGAANQRLGVAVSKAGDINGDGFDDILIGSDGWNFEKGMAYVIYGKDGSSNLGNIDLGSGSLDPSRGFQIFGISSSDRTGFAVSYAGDVNKDGKGDIMVGAYGVSYGAGRAFIIYGQAGDFSDFTLPPASGKGFTVIGAGTENLGSALSDIGDFNGDGVDDIILGAHCADSWKGRAYIIYGNSAGLPASITVPPTSAQGVMFQGVAGADNFGCLVSDAGDINGDGLKDVVIGAYGYDNYRGSAYVVLGSPTIGASLAMTSLGATQGFSVVGGGTGEVLGAFVGGGKDFNGDGLSDVIIGGSGWSSSQGSLYVLYGKQASSFSQVDVSLGLAADKGLAIRGEQAGDGFGGYAAMLEDVNLDGVNDLLVGAIESNSGKGSAYLLYVPYDCVICPSGYNLTNGVCIEIPPEVPPETPGNPGTPGTPENPGGNPGNPGTPTDPQDPEDPPSEEEPLEEKRDPVISTTTVQSTKKAAQVSSAVANLLSVGSAMPVGIGMMEKIIQNLRYLNLNYTEETQSVFLTYSSSLFGIEMPEKLGEDASFKPLLWIYEEYELAESFLANYWQSLVMIFASLAFFVFFVLVEIVLSPKEGMCREILQNFRMATGNYCLAQLYSSIDDIVFFFILEVKTTELDSSFSTSSLILAIFFLIFALAILAFHYWLLFRYQAVKKEEQALEKYEKKYENISFLYQDFKDKSVLQQSFLALLMLRSTLLILFITVMINHQSSQAILLMTINFLFAGYLLYKRPYKDLLDEITQYFAELATLAAYSSAIGLAIMTDFEVGDIDLRRSLEKVIILSGFVLFIGTCIVQFIKIFLSIYSVYLFFKKHKDSKVTPLQEKSSDITMGESTINPLHLSSTENISQVLETKPSFSSLKTIKRRRMNPKDEEESPERPLKMVFQPELFFTGVSMKIPEVNENYDQFWVRTGYEKADGGIMRGGEAFWVRNEGGVRVEKTISYQERRFMDENEGNSTRGVPLEDFTEVLRKRQKRKMRNARLSSERERGVIMM